MTGFGEIEQIIIRKKAVRLPDRFRGYERKKKGREVGRTRERKLTNRMCAERKRGSGNGREEGEKGEEERARGEEKRSADRESWLVRFYLTFK